MKKIILMILFAISAVFGAEQVDIQLSNYDKSNDAVFGMHGQNHIIFGADIGFGLEFVDGLEFVIPISARVGYLRDIGEDWAVSANLLYNKMGITRPFHRLGGEVLGYYKVYNGLYLHFGAGILKDVKPAKYTNYRDIRETTYKIDSWYPMVKFGMLVNYNEYIGLIFSLNYTWNVQNVSYWKGSFGWTFGLQFKI